MKRYEGMFLFDAAVVRDWASIEQEVRRLCERIDAELLVCVKFDERKLAYEVNKRKRGTYVLTYFNAPPERIHDLERDVHLSEDVLRVLVLRADHVTEEKLAELRAHPAEQPLCPLSGEGRGRHDDGPRRERSGDRRPRDGDDDRDGGNRDNEDRPRERSESMARSGGGDSDDS